MSYVKKFVEDAQRQDRTQARVQKYSDDQPRDDHGRWSGSGGGGESSQAGGTRMAMAPVDPNWRQNLQSPGRADLMHPDNSKHPYVRETSILQTQKGGRYLGYLPEGKALPATNTPTNQVSHVWERPGLPDTVLTVTREQHLKG